MLSSRLERFLSTLNLHLKNPDAVSPAERAEMVRVARLAIEDIKDVIADAEIDVAKEARTVDDVILAMGGSYNSSMQDLKKRIHFLFRKELSEIAVEMALSPYEVRTVMAGPAVLGETHLYGMRTDSIGICICLTDHAFMRTITSIRDFTGGNNVSIRFEVGIMAEVRRKAEATIQQAISRAG